MSFSTFVTHSALHTATSVTEPLTREITYGLNKLVRNVQPSVNEVMDMMHRGLLAFGDGEKWLNQHGVWLNVSANNGPNPAETVDDGYWKIWNKVFYATQEFPTLVDVFTLTNRGVLKEKTLDANIQRLGYASINTRQALKTLRYEIPGPADLVRFAVRHIFEPDIIEHLGYNDEYRPTLDIFHAAQGLNYPILGSPAAYDISGMDPILQEASAAAINSYNEAGIGVPTWAQCYWWAHWVLPSPTQGYQMMFRLHQDRITTYDPPEAAGLVFGIKDLELLLRANDYPPFYRPYLAAISHAVPGIRFLRQLVSTEVFSKVDIEDTLRRQGYSDGHTAVLAESLIRQDKLQRRKANESNARGQIEKYWSLGIIDSDQMRQMLIDRGVQPDDADETVALAVTQLQYDRVSKIVTAVKRQYISGKIDNVQAQSRLQLAGVRTDRAVLYIEDWTLEVKEHHREISAEKAVKWACSGYITLPDLVQRLKNLDYDDSDVKGLVAEAETCMADRIAKSLAQQAKQEAATQRQLKQIQQQAAQAIRAAQAALAKHGNPSQLRKWFCEGHISELDVYNRLEFLGWPPADITRLIGDCKSGKVSTTYKIAPDGSVTGPTVAGTVTTTGA